VVSLLDVNALIALVDSDHVGFEAMGKWFGSHAAKGWATCPLTENGMVRILSQPAYPSGRRSPSEVITLLGVLKALPSRAHHFWADDVSLSDASLFQPDFIVGSRQVTDVYLLGLAAKHGGKVVSFDRSMPWQAIRNGSRALVQIPA